METNLETRLERLAIEQWPEYPEGAHLPVTAARLGYPAARDTGPMDNGATDLYDGFGQLVARLMEEIEAVREEITAIRAERAPSPQGSPLRERMLEGQVDEMTVTVRALTGEVETLRSAAQQKELERRAREQRDRMRNFSD